MYPLPQPIKKTRHYWQQALNLSQWLIVGSSLLLNMLTWQIHAFWWSAIVFSGCLYLKKVIEVIFLHGTYRHAGQTLWKNFIFLSVFILSLDYFLGYQGWTLNYLLPIISVSTVLILVLWSLIKGTVFRQEFGYLLCLITANLSLLWLFIAGKLPIFWPSGLSILTAALILLVLVLFTGTKLKSELARRFHYK